MKPSTPVPDPLPKARMTTDVACELLALVLSFPCMDVHYNWGALSLCHPLQGSHLLLGVAVFTHHRDSTTWAQADPFIPGTSVCVPHPLPSCPSPPTPGCSRCHCRYSQRDGRSGGFQFIDISNDAAISQTSVGFSFPGYDPMARPNPAQTYTPSSPAWNAGLPPPALTWFCQTFWFPLTQWEVFGVLTFISLLMRAWTHTHLGMLSILMSSYEHCLSLSFAIFLLQSLSFSYEFMALCIFWI